MNIHSIIIHILLLLGSAFVFIAALGVYRFPDFYTRVHAATKAGAFGGAVLALAAGVTVMSIGSIFQAFLITLFFYSTNPIAGHLLNRVARASGVTCSSKTRSNDSTR